MDNDGLIIFLNQIVVLGVTPYAVPNHEMLEAYELWQHNEEHNTDWYEENHEGLADAFDIVCDELMARGEI